MSRLVFLSFALTLASSVAFSQGRPPRFWNLTHGRISEFYLAPAGTTNWGPNQAKNDKDGVVDPDERLNITGVQSGSYDVKLTDKDGRTCMAHGVKVEVGQIFSIDEKDLTACSK
jgi:hypothetical protein